MNKREYNKIKKYLEEMSHEELRDELMNWIDSDKAIQNHYLRILYPNKNTTSIDELKRRVHNCFFGQFPPSDNYMGAAMLLVKEHGRSRPPVEELADLQLHLVEKSIEFTNEYGDIDEDFYEMSEESYEEACHTIQKHRLENQFLHRCEQIVENTSHIGWGYHDELDRITREYFPEHSS